MWCDAVYQSITSMSYIFMASLSATLHHASFPILYGSADFLDSNNSMFQDTGKLDDSPVINVKKLYDFLHLDSPGEVVLRKVEIYTLSDLCTTIPSYTSTDDRDHEMGWYASKMQLLAIPMEAVEKDRYAQIRIFPNVWLLGLAVSYGHEPACTKLLRVSKAFRWYILTRTGFTPQLRHNDFKFGKTVSPGYNFLLLRRKQQRTWCCKAHPNMWTVLTSMRRCFSKVWKYQKSLFETLQLGQGMDSFSMWEPIG